MTDDPFVVLGLQRTATLAEVRDARRRLAFQLHPDHGGDLAAMQRLNIAFEACVAHVTNRRPLPEPAATPTATGTAGTGTAGTGTSRPRRGPATRRPHVEQDVTSFTIDVLPAEAFEALLVVASWIGEVLDDDPPYVLEVHLHDPAPCWCRLELVPDAGGSTVSLTVASVESDSTVHAAGSVSGGSVSAELVRDVWVDQLNRLGRQPP